ncbi:excinuclease ABC subunit UvrC [Patescibacteria group bacterium]|nr:excinuclease ABC subunit UvrC [Patescibacteria group bacterium]
MSRAFKPNLQKIPGSPGVYLMYGGRLPRSARNDDSFVSGSPGHARGQEEKVIYVGKALNLRKRVSSYWKQPTKQSTKTQALIKQVTRLDFIATDTEAEALILENELIKKYQPQYNVLLRDDKSFQYIRIGLDQKFPEIASVRRVNPADIKSRDPNRPRYFGPYTAGGTVKNTLKLLNSIFPLCGKARELNQHYDSGHPPGQKSLRTGARMTGGGLKAPCLNYHLGRCLGVCVGKATASDYRHAINEIVKFLNGDTKDVIKYLQIRMSKLSSERRFEEAARLRDRINSLEQLFEQQKVSRPKDLEQDFLGWLVEGEKMIVSRAQVRGGRLLGQQIFVLRAPLNNVEANLMSQAIITIYDKVFEDLPREIIVPVLPEDAGAIEKWLSDRRANPTQPPLGKGRSEINPLLSKEGEGVVGRRGGVRILVPQKGPNQKLLSLAQRNAAQHSGSLLDVDERLGVKKAIVDLKNLLKLKKLERLEAYDISHLGGTHTVGSMVVFKDGKPDKNGYRRFRIKTVPGIDDYAALGEVITRRLSPKRRADKRFAAGLPDAILIDGGKGQLSSVLKHVSVDDKKKIRFFSLAKREEEVFLPNRSGAAVLSKSSVALQMLQRLRDEAHRFAIGYQTSLKTKQLVGDTEKMVGIGATTRKKLVKQFGSLATARCASDSELAQVLSPKQIQSFRS